MDYIESDVDSGVESDFDVESVAGEVLDLGDVDECATVIQKYFRRHAGKFWWCGYPLGGLVDCLF